MPTIVTRITTTRGSAAVARKVVRGAVHPPPPQRVQAWQCLVRGEATCAGCEGWHFPAGGRSSNSSEQAPVPLASSRVDSWLDVPFSNAPPRSSSQTPLTPLFSCKQTTSALQATDSFCTNRVRGGSGNRGQPGAMSRAASDIERRRAAEARAQSPSARPPSWLAHAPSRQSSDASMSRTGRRLTSSTQI